PAELSPRTRVLLRGPIVPTLLRMAWPNVLVMVAQAATGLIETWFVSKLGTDALAGMALVFPGVMLMQMISAGAMGGGISSAIARALGRGRRDQADALAMHAVIIHLALGAVFSVIMLGFGRPMYRTLGGADGELDAAVTYSNVVFAGSVLLWLLNGLASIIRGTGNMLVPASVICVGVVALVPLSPLLIFGIGPFPALGIAGRWRVALLVQRGGPLGPRLLHPVRPQYRALAPYASALAFVPRDSQRGRGRRGPLGADQRDHRTGHGVGCHRRWRRRGGRVWHLGAAGISAGSARLRSRRAVGGAGRHQCRRRRAQARAPHRLCRRR